MSELRPRADNLIATMQVRKIITEIDSTLFKLPLTKLDELLYCFENGEKPLDRQLKNLKSNLEHVIRFHHNYKIQVSTLAINNMITRLEYKYKNISFTENDENPSQIYIHHKDYDTHQNCESRIALSFKPRNASSFEKLFSVLIEVIVKDFHAYFKIISTKDSSFYRRKDPIIIYLTPEQSKHIDEIVNQLSYKINQLQRDGCRFDISDEAPYFLKKLQKGFYYCINPNKRSVSGKIISSLIRAIYENKRKKINYTSVENLLPEMEKYFNKINYTIREGFLNNKNGKTEKRDLEEEEEKNLLLENKEEEIDDNEEFLMPDDADSQKNHDGCCSKCVIL